jgi:hypothetical protein
MYTTGIGGLVVDILEEEVRMEKTSRQNKSPKLILSGPVCVSAVVGWRATD